MDHERRDHGTPDAFEEIIEAMKAEDEATWRRLRAASRRPSVLAKLGIVLGLGLLVAGIGQFVSSGWSTFVGAGGYVTLVLGVTKLIELHRERVGLWRDRKVRNFFNRFLIPRR